MTTTCKQTLIEAISESDSKTDSLINSNSFQGIIQLPSELWIKMITQLGNRLVLLMEHIRVTNNIFFYLERFFFGILKFHILVVFRT
jgi:hypothetical protein